MRNKLYHFIIYFILAEYADLSTCTTFVSGVNIQASNQLASCEGTQIVILCDVNDDEERQEKFNDKKSSSQNKKNFIHFENNIKNYWSLWYA
jgi:hypothetical protein